MAMRLPNLIIAGAPKCGTTSLFDYLDAHPQVCASSVKETQYLTDPGYPLYRSECNVATGGLAHYGDFFASCARPAAPIYMEATPDYLYQETPLRILPTFPEMPHIIFVLRRPSRRVYSLFQFARNNLVILDRDVSFPEFIRMVRENDTRLRDRPILRAAVEHSKYSVYLARWFDSLGPDRIHVVLFEDMVADVSAFMRRIASMLNIDPAFYEGFHPVARNRTIQVRSGLLHRLKRACQPLITAGGFRRMARTVYEWINVEPAGQTADRADLEVMDSIDREIEPYNRQLEELGGLCLDAWYSKTR